MSTTMALFPLQLVVFPGEKLKLHIFEPRYRQLIGECRATGMSFGIPPYAEGAVLEYGTEVNLMSVFHTYENGEMDILAEGRRIFHVERFEKTLPGKLYPGGEVVTLSNDASVSPGTTKELAELYTHFHLLLETGYDRNDFAVANLSFHVAHEIGMTLEQKAQLLAMRHEETRQRAIIDHLRMAISMLEAAEETKKRIRGNGHFKHLPQLDI